MTFNGPGVGVPNESTRGRTYCLCSKQNAAHLAEQRLRADNSDVELLHYLSSSIWTPCDPPSQSAT